MGKGRLEAFSDGVIAIIITIMVLELKAPHGAQFDSLGPVIPLFLSYVLSFVYVGIYWNNHHHMLHATKRISGAVLWANLHLLFWLSLIPFTTAWMDENHFAAAPVALYGAVLLMAGVAYYLLARCLSSVNGRDSALPTPPDPAVVATVNDFLWAFLTPGVTIVTGRSRGDNPRVVRHRRKNPRSQKR